MRRSDNDANVTRLDSRERANKERQLFFLLLKDVTARTRFCQSKIYAMMAQADDPFPRPYRLSANRVAWAEHEVNAWLRARVDQGHATPQGNLAKRGRKRRRKRRVRGSVTA